LGLQTAFVIETVELTADQIITQTENYYFDTRASTKADNVWHDIVLVCHTYPSGLAFPFEIGWLHFSSMTDMLACLSAAQQLLHELEDI
jgi:hypothetical protein